MHSRSQLREKIRLKRNELSKTQQQSAALTLQQTLASKEKIQSAHHIAVYLANDGELDPSLFIHWCWQQNKSVYLPVIHPFSKGNLLFLHYHSKSQMVTNQYGIAEPKLDVRAIHPIEKIEVLCTPLVAFDHNGARLGMGGGFYDRTLEKWYQQYKVASLDEQKNIKPYPIGLAHQCQKVSEIPSEIWDIPLPEIISI